LILSALSCGSSQGGGTVSPADVASIQDASADLADAADSASDSTDGTTDSTDGTTDGSDGSVESLCASAVYENSIIELGGAGFWPMDETGATFADTIGARHGTASGTLTQGANGLLAGGKAAEFSGSGYVRIAADPLWNSPSLSIGAWATVTGGPAESRNIASVRQGTSNTLGWELRVDAADNFAFVVGDGAGAVSWLKGPALTKNQTYFVVGTFDGPTDTARLYIDGELVATETGATKGATTLPLDVGQLSTGENRYWGVIDGLAFFDKALEEGDVAKLYGSILTVCTCTTDQLSTLHAAAIETLGGVSHWSMDETGSTFADSIGGRAGDAHGTFTQGVAGLVPGGKAAEFGGDGYVRVPADSIWNSPSLTIGAWTTVTGGPAETRNIASIRQGTGSHLGWELRVDAANSFGFVVGDGTGVITWLKSPTITMGQTYFVVGTFDGATGTASLYIDGELAASKSGAKLGATDLPLDIGQLSTGENRYWGVIDEVAFFDTALSADEVTALHTSAECSEIDVDEDDDGVQNDSDNCTAVPNPDQADLDADTLGDACDGDIDGDGILNGVDNCQLDPNVTQANLDGDSLGDPCDSDDDGDGKAEGSSTDCNDKDATIHAGALETCDGKDNDCNSVVDDGHPDTDSDEAKDCVDDDDDEDGSGDLVDCAPLDKDVAPSAVETCDGLDNNCDLDVDEGCPDIGSQTECASYEYEKAVVEANGAAFWSMDETGSTFADAIGTRDGTANGTFTQGADGLLAGGKAAEFSGAGYVRVAADPLWNSASLTVGAWATVSGGPAETRNIASIRQGTGSTLGWELRVDAADNFAFVLGDGTGAVTWLKGPTIAMNQTYFVVGTFDAPSGTARLYIDGQLVATQAGAKKGTTNLPLDIGQLSTGENRYWGAIDGLAFFEKALSDGDVAMLHASILTTCICTENQLSTLHATAIENLGGVSHWSMDETGSSFADSIGGRDGEANGTFTKGVAGLVPGGKAAEFAGAGYVRVPADPMWNSPSLTIGAWATVTGGPAETRNIASNRQGTGNHLGWELRVDAADNFGFVIGDGTGAVTWLKSPTLTIGQTYFVVGTFNAATGTASLYVDGELAASKSGAKLGSTSLPLDIGQLSTGENRYWGVIDEVAYFDVALGPDDVATLHASGSCP